MNGLTMVSVDYANLIDFDEDAEARRMLLDADFRSSLDWFSSTRWTSRSEGGNTVYSLNGEANRRIEFGATASGNQVFIASDAKSRNPINIWGSGNVVIICDTRKFNGRLGITGDGNLFFVSRKCTSNGGNFVFSGNNGTIALGEDCMLSFDIAVRASDSHALVDLETRQVLNSPESIIIGAHVWIGERASILKGSRIGRGSVVGSGALVRGTVPPCSVVAGVPARVVRSGVSWTRNQAPTAETIGRLAGQLGFPFE